MNNADLIVENPLKNNSIDLVVGIPSYNEADNIGFVVEQTAYVPNQLETGKRQTDDASALE